ncbi:STAS/SEC14 domain-containing protein [Sphingomonas sp. Y38-1Y]|uniref:STAS/SEC14 domain-containing protein n=1 Tax=Sphingomonas sp. Y38-1Y TaxID=3078265 RepID=UPI0028E2791B|nr:STAS/SEC14 domain-containing protein [Sphingomonas sp. Y38-1Y]
MYAFDFDRGFELLDVSWNGLFCPREVSRYAASLRQAFAEAQFTPGYLLRIDMRGAGVQSQAGLRAFRREFAGFPAASRIAVVTESTLTQMQVGREMRQPYLEVTGSADAAMDWLIGGRRAVQPALSSLPRLST